ncbi:MAG: hypothetical protein K0R08_941 [Solimicrobium sp.]|jgi:hypothetical protein|nr:hypothetical protein [Solimicrobium sp.]
MNPIRNLIQIPFTRTVKAQEINEKKFFSISSQDNKPPRSVTMNEFSCSSQRTSISSIPFTPTVKAYYANAAGEAHDLFDDICKNRIPLVKEDLVTIYVMNADFEAREGINKILSGAEERNTLAINYLKNNTKQIEVLKRIFPMNDQKQKDDTEIKLYRLITVCNDLMNKEGTKGGDKKRYDRSVSAFIALNTFYFAIGHEG